MKQLHTLIKKAQHSPARLWLLNQILSFSIPFNKPHGFKISAIEDYKIITKAPYRKKNFNHLRGIHACAIATVGELSAGLSLMHHFSPKQFRFIMSHLTVDYHYQAKKGIFAETIISQEIKTHILDALNQSEKTLQTITTDIYDTENTKIATVQTTWQIKDWKHVKTKL